MEVGNFGGTAIFIFLKEEFFWTSNEESQMRKEDEGFTARISIRFVYILIYMLEYVYVVLVYTYWFVDGRVLGGYYSTILVRTRDLLR